MKFLPNLSSRLALLYQLLKVTTHWKWTKVDEEAFINSKKLLSYYPVLVPFDPKCEVIVACDTSPYSNWCMQSFPTGCRMVLRDQ